MFLNERKKTLKKREEDARTVRIYLVVCKLQYVWFDAGQGVIIFLFIALANLFSLQAKIKSNCPASGHKQQLHYFTRSAHEIIVKQMHAEADSIHTFW